MLNLFLIFALIAIAYLFWIRPILKQQPSLKEFYDVEGSFWSAFKLKTAGIKQKLVGAIGVVAIIVVQVYDKILPLMTGVDTTKFVSLLPAWAQTDAVQGFLWPMLSIGSILLLNYFRDLADKRHEEVVTAISNDSAATMQAATVVVQEKTGLAPAAVMQEISDKKIEAVQ